MSDQITDAVIRCRFVGCDPSTIAQVTLAIVDQLGAAVDADMSVLEALDYPLTDGIDALSAAGIDAIEFRVSGTEVRLDAYIGRDPVDSADAFGDAQDAVETFFDVSFPDASVVRLVGSVK